MHRRRVLTLLVWGIGAIRGLTADDAQRVPPPDPEWMERRARMRRQFVAAVLPAKVEAYDAAHEEGRWSLFRQGLQKFEKDHQERVLTLAENRKVIDRLIRGELASEPDKDPLLRTQQFLQVVGRCVERAGPIAFSDGIAIVDGAEGASPIRWWQKSDQAVANWKDLTVDERASIAHRAILKFLAEGAAGRESWDRRTAQRILIDVSFTTFMTYPHMRSSIIGSTLGVSATASPDARRQQPSGAQGISVSDEEMRLFVAATYTLHTLKIAAYCELLSAR